MAERQAQRPDRPDVNGPVEKLITELQQSRKMHMIEHLQAKLLEDQRRSLKHLESVQSGLSIMRAGALRSRPSTSPAANMAAATVEDLGLHRMSFSETLRAEVEASRSACGIAPEVSRTKTAPEATTATMAQIPEQPELERPKTTPGTCGNSSQSLSTRGLKSMKTAGTVKFQGTSGSGPLGVSWTDEEEEFYRFHEECFYASNVRDLSGLSDRALFRQKGQSKVLSQSSDVITFDFGDSGRRLAIADREGQLSVWNVADREKLWSSSISSCTTMAFSLCGKFIAAVNNEGVVHFWNLSSDPQSTPLQTFSAASKVNALAFSADKGLALSTAEKVVLLAAPSLQEVAVLPQTGDVRELSFSPDGAFLVAAGLHVDPRSSIMVEDGDPSAGAVFWSVTDSFRRLGSMVFRQVLRVTTFRPDGKLLALAGDNKLITLLDVLNDFDHDGDLPCGQPVRALAWSPNLRCLASGGEDRMVTVWDLASKHVLFQMDPMKDWIFKLAWSATGLLAFSHLGAHGVRLAPLEEVQDKKEITLERPNTEEDLAEKEETPQFVFLVKVASTPGGPVEPKKVLEEEGFNVNIARDRVDLDPIALDLSCKNPGLQVAAQDPTYVTGHHLVSCSFTPHETLMIAGEDIFEFEVANRSKNREIHLRDVAKALAISPCGGYVAVANAFLVTVHRLMSKGQEAVLNQKVTSNVVCLAFSAQQFLAVGTMEKKVLVFHLEDKKEPEILSVQVNSLCFSPTGNLLAVPGSDGSGKVSLWQVAREGCEFAGLVKTRNAAHVACFTEAGKVLAVGCEDARVVLLAVEYGFKCWSELRCNFPVHYLTLSGSFLAAGGDRDICVFNISSSQIALQLPRQEERIQGISLSTSGSLLACCFRGHVTLLPLESVTEVTQASMKVPDNKDRYKSRGTVTSLSLKSSPSDVMHTIHLSFADVQAGEDASLQVSRSLKSTGSCSNLDMGDAEEGRRSFHKSISLPFESKVGEDSAGTEAYIPVDEDGEVSPPPWLLKPRISVTDMSQGEVSRCTTPGEKEEDPEARALRKRQLLARDLGLDPAIQSKISIAGREGEGCGPIKLKHKDEVQSLSFHPSGSSLVAGGYDQELMLWNADSHSPAAQHHIESEIVAVCFSPCGEYVFCGDTEREINVFKANTLELLAAEVLKEQFGCLAGISSPTQLLAVGCTAVVKIFSVPKLEEVISLEHGGQVHSLSFSPSLGMLAAAGGIDLTNGLLDYSAKDHRDCMKAMVWKSTDMAGLWDEVTTINYKDFCHAAAFSPSGTALALAGEDRLISILSVGKNFQKVEELPCGAGIRCLSWSHSSRLLASAGEDMRVSVWDVLFKRVVLHLPKADDWLCSLSFSADSKWLATCGYGQDTVDLWPIEVEEKEFLW